MHRENGSGRIVKFGDVVRDVNESEKNPTGAGLWRYVGLEHMEPENLRITEWGDLTTDEVSFTKRFRAGQVLFGKRRAYQRKVAVADFDGICSSDILAFEPKNNDLVPELLPFIVQSERFFEHALGTSSGSLSPRTRWSQLRDFQFRLPSNKEQQRIAKLLLAASNCRNAYIDAIHQIEATRKLAMIKSFAPISGDPSSEEIQRVQLPSGWSLAEAKSLSIAPVTKGETPRGKLSPDIGDIPFIKIYNLSFEGILDFSIKPTFVSLDAHMGALKRSQVLPGDLLMNLVGPPLGKIGLVTGEYSEWNINQAIARYRPSNALVGKYLWFYLQSAWAQRWLHRRSKKTSGQRNLTLKLAQELPIPVADDDAMLLIVERLESIDHAKIHLNNTLSHVQRVQNALSHKFFGKN